MKKQLLLVGACVCVGLAITALMPGRRLEEPATADHGPVAVAREPGSPPDAAGQTPATEPAGPAETRELFSASTTPSLETSAPRAPATERAEYVPEFAALPINEPTDTPFPGEPLEASQLGAVPSAGAPATSVQDDHEELATEALIAVETAGTAPGCQECAAVELPAEAPLEPQAAPVAAVQLADLYDAPPEESAVRRAGGSLAPENLSSHARQVSAEEDGPGFPPPGRLHPALSQPPKIEHRADHDAQSRLARRLEDAPQEPENPFEDTPPPDLNEKRQPLPPLPEDAATRYRDYDVPPEALEPLEGMNSWNELDPVLSTEDGVSCCQGIDTPCDKSCCSPWMVRADVMFLTRARGADRTLARAGVNGPETLNASDLTFGARPATRLLLSGPLNDRLSLEGQFYGLANWRSTGATIDPNNNLYTPFSQFGANPPAVGPVPAGFTDTDRARVIDARYGSHLTNAEMNLSYFVGERLYGQMSLLTGARYFRLREGFDYNTATALGNSSTNVETSNNLFGWQAGIRWARNICDCLCFDTDWKIGMYGNQARTRTATNATILGFESYGARRGQMAMLTDVGLNLNYSVTQRFSLRAGYTLVYVAGVALASNNFAPTPPPAVGSAFRATLPPGAPGPNPIPGQRNSRINSADDTFYHGLTLGMEYAY